MHEEEEEEEEEEEGRGGYDIEKKETKMTKKKKKQKVNARCSASLRWVAATSSTRTDCASLCAWQRLFRSFVARAKEGEEGGA